MHLSILSVQVCNTSSTNCSQVHHQLQPMTQRTPRLFHVLDYRGATIEDLDIRPAISISPLTTLRRAFQVAFENEFTFLPVILNINKRLLGVLSVLELSPTQLKKAGPDALVKDHMLWFSQNAREKYAQEIQNSKDLNVATPLNTKIFKPKPTRGKQYEVLTPLSALEDLAKFFNSGNYFAIITTGEGNLVYGVVTPEDLSKYEKSRPRL